jgi:cleavage stimulation factor subunit 1
MGPNNFTRTFLQKINEIDFHPTKDLFAVATEEGSVQFFEAKSKKIKPFLTLPDSFPCKSVCFHPLGKFLLCGTLQNVIRLYDIETQCCYQSKSIREAHKGAITMVRFAPQANMYVSSSKDGSIKLWDGRNGLAVRSILSAHGNQEVCSAVFSRSQRYILTSGKDARIKLWDIRFGEPLLTIAVNGTGAANNKHFSNAIFSLDEDLILGTSEPLSAVVVWNSKNGEETQRLTGHKDTVRYLEASPVDNSIVSCWYEFFIFTSIQL